MYHVINKQEARKLGIINHQDVEMRHNATLDEIHRLAESLS